MATPESDMKKLSILPGLVTAYVVTTSSNKFTVWINGKNVKKVYDTEKEACQVAIRGAEMLLNQALEELKSGRLQWKKVK